MAIATFDYAAWSTLYPQLAPSVGEPLAALLFAHAGLYLDNTEASPVIDVATRQMLLYMLVAHLAVLGGYVTGSAQAQGLVGRVTSASEGSVSVSVDAGLEPGTAAWYSQTSYGLNFWQATRGHRTARYYPARQPSFEPGILGRRRWQFQ